MPAPTASEPIAKPLQRPKNQKFSSGPCAKRPGWTPQALSAAILGRSHRSPGGLERIQLLTNKTKSLLQLPNDYRIAIVPGSDTGAFELAMWSLLGARGVDVLVWESFSKNWATDITKHLKLGDVGVLEAPYGKLPDLGHVDFDRDVVLTWNGTTSGVCVPDSDWIPSYRQGLTLVDATSAVFAQKIDWTKTDVVTFSWQKVLGGEAAHGMIILTPRAVERLESHTPPWPLPKIFRLTKGGKINEGIFQGQTINTPLMLCVEDCLDALNWIEELGGAQSVMARCDGNAQIIHDWVNTTPWIKNLADDPRTRSNTSVCLRFTDPDITQSPLEAQRKFAKNVAHRLEAEHVAYDIAYYRDAPPGLRIWTGATIEAADIQRLLPWVDWAYHAEKAAV